MDIHSVRLQNIRTHSDSSFEFTEGVNILIGPNACGKTTVLEAVSLLARGSTPGSVTTKDILRRGSDWHRIDMSIGPEQRIFKNQNDLKEFVIGGQTKKRYGFSDLQPVVWFDPEELRLLRGSPNRRREYFDQLLSQLKPRYKDSLNRYKRALLQRNTLLKNQHADSDSIFVWNLRLAENAEVVYAGRLELVQKINSQIKDLYKHLSGEDKDIQLTYQTEIKANNYADNLLKALQRSTDKDRLLGFTSTGVHRDDFIFVDSSSNSKLSAQASRGEIRTLMLALKLIEVQKLEEATKKKPIILFDDVFSELDGARRKAFTGSLKGYQTIVTTTDADIVTKDFAAHANIIALN